MNQKLPTAAQPQGWEEKYAPNLAPEIIFRYAASPEGHVAEACLHILEKFFQPYNPDALPSDQLKLSGEWAV